MPDFTTPRPFVLGGGLNLADAPEMLEDGEATLLTNVRFVGENRWTPRRAARQVAAGFQSCCGVFGFPHGETATGRAVSGVYLDWTGTRVDLYVCDSDGRRDASPVGTLAGWDPVGQRPKVIAAVLAECIWIVDEGKKYGLTVYDPNERFEQGILWQPKFKFNRSLDTPASPIFARCVASYNNFLFVAGHGSEDDPDRPEMVRFSYLGLEFEPTGQGDASLDPLQPNPDYDELLPDSVENQPFLPVAGGVGGLFDIEDYALVGQRGQPVVGMVQGAERLVICTRFAAYILFGYDRTSFFLDLVDNQRGLVASRAIGEADGIVWWFSPLGPCYWGGGRVQGLETKVTPRLREIDHDSIFFGHQRAEYECRWYYSVDGGDPNRSLVWNYLRRRYKEEHLGVRLFCAGVLKPGTILRPGPGGNPLPGPPPEDPGNGGGFPLLTPICGFTSFTLIKNPNDATFDIVWNFEWQSQETGPGIVTDFQARVGVGSTYGEIVELDTSESLGLVVARDLQAEVAARVRHRRIATGEISDWCEDIADPPDTIVSPPVNFRITATEVFAPGGGQKIFRYDASWVLAGIDVYTTIEIRKTATGVVEFRFSGLGLSSLSFQLSATFASEYQFRAQHTTEANGQGITSDWTDYIPPEIV